MGVYKCIWCDSQHSVFLMIAKMERAFFPCKDYLLIYLGQVYILNEIVIPKRYA